MSDKQKASCFQWLSGHRYCPNWDTSENERDTPGRQGGIVSIITYNGSLRIRLEKEKCKTVLIRVRLVNKIR